MEDRIEGAGAAIVNHAAELETQGMDAVGKTDEEAELPVALQDLIQRLQGKAGPGAEPLEDLPNLTEPKYGDFFTRVASPSTNMEWRNQVRLRVLEAIGSCNTLRFLNLTGFSSPWRYFFITAGECEVVLRGVQSSTVLESLSVGNSELTSAAEVERLCLLLRQILETSSTLESLLITHWRLTARDLSHLASGLQANSQSNPKCLRLEGALEDASVVKHVFEVVNSAPRLEHLMLARVGMIDEDDVQTLSQALIQSSSLKSFSLSEAKGGASALLLKAFAGDSRNQSIETLQLRLVSGFEDCLPAILSTNRSLREVRLFGSDMRPKQWHVIGQAIRDNATATSIRVLVDWKGCTREWHEGVQELVCAASSDVKDPIIQFDIHNMIHPSEGLEGDYTYMDVDEVTLPYNLLEQAWSGKVKSLRCLQLDFPLSSNQLLHVKRFVRALGNGEPSTLKELHLQRLKGNLLPGVWKQLFWCMRGNTSLAHLGLLGCEGLDEEAFKDLMGLLQVNLTLQSIRVSGSSWEKDGKEALIQEALRQNKKRAAYVSVFRDAKLKFGDAKAGRLFLCGSPKADTFRYFIPSFIREHASKEKHDHQDGADIESMSWNSKHENSQFVGIRIQCKDERRMSLTAAFFPRFQIFMRHKLISEMHVCQETVTCSRHYLRVFLDGHEIYIEHIQSEKSHNHVDVLMLCSKHKSREVAVKYVMKHIVEELISFCASPKGCPGVALVLGVIQTQCVQMLIPSHLRGVILIEKLKSNFLSSLKEQLEEIALDRSYLVKEKMLDRSYLMKEEMLLNYEHSWPPIQGYSLSAFERAKDLLWESDVEAVVNEIQQQRSQQLESLQQGLSNVNNDLTQSDSESEKGVGNLSLAQIKNWRPASASRLIRASTTVENRSTRLVLSKLDQLGEKVDGLDDRLRAVESIMQRVENKMGQILSLQHELQSTLSAFMSSVDRCIGYSESLQQARTPKRPYITVDDVGSLSRITAALRFGRAVRLHLMCESVTGIHTVKDQEGLELRLD
ncbi:hypothetical protein Mapa_013159 [Marchantia paleacea]|nr:hypothetical protein Mapa_013159 [Marchantia paleacea]